MTVFKSAPVDNGANHRQEAVGLCAVGATGRGLVFSRLSCRQGPGAVSGLEQGSLALECRYNPGWETYMKWWCRGASWHYCEILVKPWSEQEVKNDRVSIRNHQKDRTFTMTMEELRLGDSDTYWCGIERVGNDLGAQVTVNIYPGSSALSGPGAVQGWERGSLTVECRYDPGYETYKKRWCRRIDWISCKTLVETTGSEQEVRRGRVSIRDHQENRRFTVTMEKLRLDDADTYWCGIKRFGVDLEAQVEVTIDQAATTIMTTAISTAATTTLTAPVTAEKGNGHPTVTGTRELLLPITVVSVLLLVLTASFLAWRVGKRQRRGWRGQLRSWAMGGWVLLSAARPSALWAPPLLLAGSWQQRRLRPEGPFQKEDVSYTVLSLGASGQEPTYGNMEQFATHDPRRGREEPTEYSAVRKH
ncbi:CMRF35-like molecule 1 [Galemys pyrenaicus]|uniref:CMRF35-like molecule 1 n=1 Tax=Galemys pyrenaicus TaxID=202257 RepID=A0A8J6DMN1_GALPY|nr:CMRF35-like molecule 1 [Galemys pyrenaicus]